MAWYAHRMQSYKKCLKNERFMAEKLQLMPNITYIRDTIMCLFFCFTTIKFSFFHIFVRILRLHTKNIKAKQ